MESAASPRSVVHAFTGPVQTGDSLDSDETTRALMDRIRSLGLGGRLPSERELALDLGVSRTLLRDRLSLLESLGVLERRTGAGTTIRGLDPTRLGHSLSIGLMIDDSTTASLQSVRMAIERQAAKEAAIRRDHVAIAYMTVALDRMRPPADSLAVEQADFEFHSAMIRASGSSSLIFFAEAINIPLRRSFADRRLLREQIPGERELMIELHEPILTAIRDGLPVEAMSSVDAAFDRFDQAVGDLPAGR